MDPFSLATGIAGLVTLAATTISVAKTYISGAKNARTSITTIINELEALQSNLSSLDDFLRHHATKGLVFQRTSVLRSCTSACEGKLTALCKKLNQVGDSRMGRYLWPLNEKEHLKIVEELRAFSHWLQFALSVDGCLLLSKTSEDVMAVLGQQLESFRVLQSLEVKTAQLEDAVKVQTCLLQDNRIAERRKNILDWISKHVYSQKHYSVRPPRVGGTGNWFFQREKYVQWRDGVSALNVLWCYGIQGSGKTVLTSIIIDDLTEFVSPSPVAFFYFDYQDQEGQTSSCVLSSALRQIVATMPEIPISMIEAYNKRGSEDSLSLNKLEEMCNDVIVNLDRTYIIIDALDECDERYRKDFLQCIDRLKCIRNIHILITSRYYPTDIYAALHTYPQIEIRAQDSDLENYICQELEHAGLEDVVDNDFATQIVETLISRAQGMFLLPILQLRTILKEPTAGDMEDALASLSRNLSEAFEETVTRIHRLPENRSRVGISTLMWICHAKRAMTVFELSCALSIKPGQTAMRLKHCPSQKMMLDCCQGLVTIDPESLSIRFAHYSIQEYLIGHSGKLFLCAEANLATTCLTYLLFDIFKNGPHSEWSEVQSRIESNPFLPYASTYWGVHVKASETEQSVQQLTLALFESHEAMASAVQIHQFTKGYRKVYWNPEECYSYTPLHLTSTFALENMLRKLMDEERYFIDVDTSTKMGSTPLINAASNGHACIVKMLLERGANPYLENWYGNALHCAAEAGASNTVSELIRHGMTPNESKRYSRVPIFCTLDNDHDITLETLITLGADIEVCDRYSESVFHEAVMHNCIRIVDLILQRRWVDIESKTIQITPWSTAMHIAAIKSCSKTILLKLIEAGADINSRDRDGQTPLDYAYQYENKEAVKILLDHGAFRKHPVGLQIYECHFPPCLYRSKREENYKHHMRQVHGLRKGHLVDATSSISNTAET